MLNPEVKVLVEAGITAAASAAGVPAMYVPGLVELFEVIASAPDVATALARAKQNAVADAEDAAVEAGVDQALKHGV